MWEEHLMFQLLWFNGGSSFDDDSLTTMPSWSWAAMESAKRWPSEETSFGQRNCQNDWPSPLPGISKFVDI
ncbi:hypothetical protein SNOG_12750 [Parastagonospora nodorum SN15]|uniref:Uncharacterized protein n=1 Tax=Phaeosphaeria nodorum (strain SN15 / ATCC MYA-4574 / FGSC 10173) TaxID=321614 RepID=Q0U664_PHANO|nr:hypothetical protein SNOG_12750 [Parastagonospora nodorum SN15]EAT80048.1 hypothetical protein SNOG_12750 [Parastagonospora nodorum SN15]